MTKRFTGSAFPPLLPDRETERGSAGETIIRPPASFPLSVKPPAVHSQGGRGSGSFLKSMALPLHGGGGKN